MSMHCNDEGLCMIHHATKYLRWQLQMDVAITLQKEKRE